MSIFRKPLTIGEFAVHLCISIFAKQQTKHKTMFKDFSLGIALSIAVGVGIVAVVLYVAHAAFMPAKKDEAADKPKETAKA